MDYTDFLLFEGCRGDKYLNVASSDVIIGTIIAYVSLQESVRLHPSFKE